MLFIEHFLHTASAYYVLSVYPYIFGSCRLLDKITQVGRLTGKCQTDS